MNILVAGIYVENRNVKICSTQSLVRVHTDTSRLLAITRQRYLSPNSYRDLSDQSIVYSIGVASRSTSIYKSNPVPCSHWIVSGLTPHSGSYLSSI